MTTTHPTIDPARPKVTIAIPTFNRAAYLRQAVDSALAQTYANIEVLISDNASTDETSMLLESLVDSRVRIVRQNENIGMMANWNACLALASGEYFLMLSDDDLLDPAAIETMVAHFFERGRNGQQGKQEQVGVVYCHSRIIDHDGRQIDVGKSAQSCETAACAIDEFFNLNRHTFPCSILLRTDDAKELGGYDALNYSLIADAQMWMKVALKRGKVMFIQQTLASYRVHPVSTTNTVRIQSWLDNNSALAAFCCSELTARGNAILADSIRRRICRFNARAAASLLENAGRGRIARAWQYVKLSRNFLSIESAPVVVACVAKILIPARLKKIVKAALRLGGGGEK